MPDGPSEYQDPWYGPFRAMYETEHDWNTGQLKGGAKGYRLEHNGTNWVRRQAQVVDIRDYSGADPTGTNDSAAAINQALIEAATLNGQSGQGTIPVVLTNGNSAATYSITDSIVIPEGGSLMGVGLRGIRSKIQMVDATGNKDKHGITTWPTGNRSGFQVHNIWMTDARTDPTRLGNGINANRARDYVSISDCLVGSFYDNYFFGADVGGVSQGDRGTIERCWTINPIRYGMNFLRITNHFLVIGCMADTNIRGDAVINVQGSTADSQVTVIATSHETQYPAHTIQTDGSPLTAINVTAAHGGDGTHDIIRITAGYGTETTLINITAQNQVFDPNGTAGPANLLNLVERGWTIPVAERRINFWTGWGGGTSDYPATIRAGRHKVFSFEASPEGVVSAEPGSLAMRSNGILYEKYQGTGKTGWRRVRTYDDRSVTIAAGTGAGTSPTISVSGHQQAGTITLTTGAAPAANANVAVITYTAAFPFNKGTVVLSPANKAAAQAVGVYANQSSSSTSQFTVSVGDTALAASTQYIWNYIIMGDG